MTEISIDTAHVGIDLATGFGPRVIGMRPAGHSNLFAELGDLAIDLPDGRHYCFHGGHRLWLAPEVPEITYAPDDDPVDAGGDNLTVWATGRSGDVEKTIRIEVAGEEAMATVDHAVTNGGDRPIRPALWAITQLRPGGTALLPFTTNPSDPHGLQASTGLVGWPYTDWAALEFDDGVIYIDGTRETPTKVGTALSRGWLAYVIDGWLFAKYATVGESSLDLGATGQIYACADFVELETIGVPLTLEPGETAQHREMWRVWPAPDSLHDAVALAESAL